MFSPQKGLCDQLEVVANAVVVTNSSYTIDLINYIVHLKLTQCYVSIIFQ